MRSTIKFITLSLLITSTFSQLVNDKDWWKTARIYQIYPRSFRDSNNDGIGDLQGIIEKLDYIEEIGVKAIWLSPIFKSPQVDQGYDISNYTDIEPDYGSLDDIETLIKSAHNKSMKVILDFVPNHSSDQHQWFIDSVNGIEEYRDYYVWRDAKIDKNGERQPPNNWISVFKNSAWTWSEERQQYYLHQFAPQQPDLNFRNPKVLKAMREVLIFWLDRGIDGFRIDAIPHLMEDPEFKDEPYSRHSNAGPLDYNYLKHIYTKDLPDTYEVVYDWRKLIDNYTIENGGDQRILMTEAYTASENIKHYYLDEKTGRPGAHFAFNFNLITDIDRNSTAEDLVRTINKWLDSVPENHTSNWVIGNHDNNRVATRFGPKSVDGYNMLTAILPGVQVTYNGEEIGQEDGEVTYEEGQDPSAREPEIFQLQSRDFERTPFQWDNSTNAGFNKGAKPWLPVSKKYISTNLEQQKLTHGKSPYKIYKNLTMLRNDEITIYGSTEICYLAKNLLLVRRCYEDASLSYFFNNGDELLNINVGAFIPENNSVVISSTNSPLIVGQSINVKFLRVAPYESFILKYKWGQGGSMDSSELK